MKKCIYLFLIFLVIGCTHQEGTHKQLTQKNKEELKADTKILKSLNDSLNHTGNRQYYIKYINKIDEMIKKYPDPYRKNYLKVRESMIEIYGDSIK